MGEPESIDDMIESRTYLFDFQKKQLVEDLELIPSDDERIEKIMDTILYRLFCKNWNDLTTMEKQDILFAWKGK